MINLTKAPTFEQVALKLPRVWEVAAKSTKLVKDSWNPTAGTPVFTADGTYTSRGWTEWTQGFQFGNSLLLFEATGEKTFLTYGRDCTKHYMAPHVSHIGVHDHGFNNVSTYGNLLRLMTQGSIENNPWEAEFYALGLKISGAIQASRWTNLGQGKGFIHSFNGPHSLFADTIRSLRSLALGHQLGHLLMGEQDEKISLLDRLVAHSETTAQYIVYYGSNRDTWDIRGRTVHEGIFNTVSQVFRNPSTQQGYTAFSTWTRGLAWIITGFAEELEWLDRPGSDIPSRDSIRALWLRAACATADFWLEQNPTDGIPYWDTGAPGLVHLGDFQSRPADPYNDFEPVDSSAAAITAQGLWRLADYLTDHGSTLSTQSLDLDGHGPCRHTSQELIQRAERYRNAALVMAHALFNEPYLSVGQDHQGILLHSVYHRPNNWDFIPKGSKIPRGESSMWGDYHLLEFALMLDRVSKGKKPQQFFDITFKENQ
jgi:unsaturated chondroitin disaccharide hydrolase